MVYEIGQANRLGNRNTNQDRFAAIETDEGVLLVLADGMGGQAQGEIAAQLLVDTAEKLYLNAKRPISRPKPFLEKILFEAHRNIVDFGQQQTPPLTPGTTGVICLLQGGKAIWAHVGDSRLYLFQNGLPLYRTTDHSFVEMLYQKGEISRREQETHPKRNQITQCLGGGLPGEPKPTFSNIVALSEEDILLLCTDGLWGPMDDAVMGRLLCTEGKLDDIINTMAEQAEHLSYPKSDNISVLALKVLSLDEGAMAEGKTTEKNKGDDDPLASAIADIEAVIKEYEGEFGK